MRHVRLLITWREGRGTTSEKSEYYYAEQLYADREQAESALPDWLEKLGVDIDQCAVKYEDAELE